jgi:hypothetical protein
MRLTPRTQSAFPPRGQDPQVSDDLIRCGDRGQIAAQAGGLGDGVGVFGVSLALTGVCPGHPVDQPPRDVHHRRPGGQQEHQQQPSRAGGHVHRPRHLVGRAVSAGDQLLDRGLPVGQLLAEHHPACLIDRARMVLPLADVDPDPDLLAYRHAVRLPSSLVKPVDNPACSSINSDQAHRFQSAARESRTTWRPLLRSHPTASNHQPHHAAPGIQNIQS